jgi:hypothetical protein
MSGGRERICEDNIKNYLKTTGWFGKVWNFWGADSSRIITIKCLLNF